MTQEETARSIAAELVAEAEKGREFEPQSRTHAIAHGMTKSAETFKGKHLADDSLEGALTVFAGDANEDRSYDGDEVFSNALDTNAVLDTINSRGRQ